VATRTGSGGKHCRGERGASTGREGLERLSDKSFGDDETEKRECTREIERTGIEGERKNPWWFRSF